MKEERKNQKENAEVQIMLDQVVAQIREEAESLERVETIWPDTEQAYQSILSSQDQALSELYQLRGTLHQSARNPFFWDLGGGVKGFVRKAVRKIAQCILLPLTERQNDFNQQTENAIGLIIRNMEHQKEMMDNLNQRIRRLEEGTRFHANQTDHSEEA